MRIAGQTSGDRYNGGVLALVTLAGPIVFAACWVLSADLQGGYRLVRDDESALAAAGAAHPWITMTGDTAVGIAMVALSIVLSRIVAGTRRTTGCALLALGGLAVVIQALVREDCVKDLGFCPGGREESTWHQSVHDGASAIAFLTILAAMFVLAGPFRDHGLRRLARSSTYVGAAGLALLLVFIALSDSSVAGIAELVFLIAPTGWLALVALVLAGHLRPSLER
jgi:hypothetical membrane protein